MRTRGPIVTLLAVVVLAFALLAVNMFSGRTRAADDAARPADPTPAALAAPPPSTPTAFPDRVSYAGRTSGRKAGEATVEIAIRNGTATAYVCDGAKLESWLHGTVSGSSVTLRGKGTDELTAELRPAGAGGRAGGGAALSGTVTLAGGRWPFTAAPGKAPTAERRADQNAASVAVPGTPAPNAARQAAPNPGPAAPQPAPAPDDAGSSSDSGGY